MQQFKKKWGLIVLGMAIVIFGLILFCENVLNLHLRNAPHIFLICLEAAAVCAFLTWADIQVRYFLKAKKSCWTGALLSGIRFTSVLLSLALMFTALIGSMMTNRPEHEVQENGVRMVARVNAFLDVYVDYYEYHGFLFYGKKLGSEYYGSGGYDPFECQEKPVPRQRSFPDLGSGHSETVPPENTEEPRGQEAAVKSLNPQVTENRSGEFVFDSSINDFIDCYNSLCRASQDSVFLGPASDWKSSMQESGIHSDYETVVYLFSEDGAVHSLPTVTVYAPSNTDAIQEITVDFDDHGYSESLFEQYRKMCFYTVKTFLPEMPDDEITKLCATLNTLANENLLSKEEWFGHDAVPPALFYKDGIGVYPYFAVGQCSHLCVVPVTQEIIAQFEMKGVKIYEINDKKLLVFKLCRDRTVVFCLSAILLFLPGCGKQKNVPVSSPEETSGSFAVSTYPTETVRHALDDSLQDIAKLYLDEYAAMEKVPAEYPTGAFVLSQAGIDRIEEILINAGYSVIDEQEGYPPYLANSDGLRGFLEKVQSGEAATQAVLQVNRNGGFSQILFQYIDGAGLYSRTDVALDDENKPYVEQIEKHSIFDWDITPRNVFYYQIYPGGDKHYPDYNTIRLDPPDKPRWDMTVKYVYPICYQAVNAFLCDWSETDYSAVHFNDLFEYLYRDQKGELFNPEKFTYSSRYDGYSIPADLFEKTILPYFTISLEDFRKSAMYDADTDAYPWRPFYTNDVIWYPAIEPEVVSYTDNGNGTMTLHIEVSSTDVKTDCLFAHDLTVRLLDDGKFQYVGNKITYQTEEYGLPPAEPRITGYHP